jgi:hypothetical protein
MKIKTGPKTLTGLNIMAIILPILLIKLRIRPYQLYTLYVMIEFIYFCSLEDNTVLFVK